MATDNKPRRRRRKAPAPLPLFAKPRGLRTEKTHTDLRREELRRACRRKTVSRKENDDY